MISKKQGVYMRRNTQLKTFFAKNQGIISGYGPFADEVNVFNKNMAKAEAEINGKNTTATGITDGKEVMKMAIAETCGSICSIGRSYSVAIGDTELEAQIYFTYSDIFKQKDPEVLSDVTRIYDAISPLTKKEDFMSYGVTQAQLDAMMEDGNVFNNVLGEAAVVEAESSVANKNLNGLIKDMNGNVKQFRLLAPHFKTTEPKFVEGFEINARLNNSGVRHSGFAGKVTSVVTGEVIDGAEITLEGTDKKAVSQLDGTYELIKLQSKLFRVVVTAKGYEPKTFVIKIERGKILEMNIEL